MEKDLENKKDIWTEPRIYNIDFRETQGGTSPDAAEDLQGTLSTLPG